MSEYMYKWGNALLFLGIILMVAALLVPMHPNPRLFFVGIGGIVTGSGLFIMVVQWYYVLRQW